MAAKVVINLPAPDDVLAGYSAGAVLQLQRATDEAFTTPVDVTEIAVVAATYQYEYWDTSGDATTWYRWRAENTGDTETGDWSAAFQGVEAAAIARASGAYASIDDYLVNAGTTPVDSRRLVAIERALASTREELDEEVGGRDAFRHPQTGTETRTFHGDGSNLLHVHDGIVSISTVEIRTATNGTWIALDSDDWWLEGAPPGTLTVPSGQPYWHLRLSDMSSYSTFPKGENRIRLVGAFGWPRPSLRHVQANIALASQRIAADYSFPGGIVGLPQLGAPVGPNRLPDPVWRLKLAESARFKACST